VRSASVSRAKTIAISSRSSCRCPRLAVLGISGKFSVFATETVATLGCLDAVTAVSRVSQSQLPQTNRAGSWLPLQLLRSNLDVAAISVAYFPRSAGLE